MLLILKTLFFGVLVTPLYAQNPAVGSAAPKEMKFSFQEECLTVEKSFSGKAEVDFERSSDRVKNIKDVVKVYNPKCDHYRMLTEGASLQQIYNRYTQQKLKAFKANINNSSYDFHADGTCIPAKYRATNDNEPIEPDCLERLERDALRVQIETRQNILRYNKAKRDLVDLKSDRISPQGEDDAARFKENKKTILNDFYKLSRTKDGEAKTREFQIKAMLAQPQVVSFTTNPKPSISLCEKDESGKIISSTADCILEKDGKFEVVKSQYAVDEEDLNDSQKANELGSLGLNDSGGKLELPTADDDTTSDPETGRLNKLIDKVRKNKNPNNLFSAENFEKDRKLRDKIQNQINEEKGQPQRVTASQTAGAQKKKLTLEAFESQFTEYNEAAKEKQKKVFGKEQGGIASPSADNNVRLNLGDPLIDTKEKNEAGKEDVRPGLTRQLTDGLDTYVRTRTPSIFEDNKTDPP